MRSSWLLRKEEPEAEYNKAGRGNGVTSKDTVPSLFHFPFYPIVLSPNLQPLPGKGNALESRMLLFLKCSIKNFSLVHANNILIFCRGPVLLLGSSSAADPLASSYNVSCPLLRPHIFCSLKRWLEEEEKLLRFNSVKYVLKWKSWYFSYIIYILNVSSIY